MLQPEQETPMSSSSILQPAPVRPRTLLQRISSYMPSLPVRRSTPNQRPESAPNLPNTASGRWTRYSLRREEQDPLLPTLHLPSFSRQPCPNDPSTYYSFPSIEKRRCNLCGFCGHGPDGSAADPAWTSGAKANIRRCSLGRPCTPARLGRPCAHLAGEGSRNMSPGHTRSHSRLQDVVEGTVLGPRIASPSQRQVNSNPRRVSFPRIPPLNSYTSSQARTPNARPPTRRGPIPDEDRSLTFDTLFDGTVSSSDETRKTPSPKLHHVLGSEDRPYLHRHEAAQYLSTLEATGQSGVLSTTPLATSRPYTALGMSESSRRDSDAGRLYSHTVFYPNSPVRAAVHSDEPAQATIQPVAAFLSHRPRQPNNLTISLAPLASVSRGRPSHATFPRPLPATAVIETIEASGTVTVDGGGRPVSVDLQLETSDAYGSHGHSDARQQPGQDGVLANGDSSSSGPSTDTPAQTPSNLGGKRLELRGGNGQTPRMRGGGRTDAFASILSTCRQVRDACFPCVTFRTYDITDDLPPVRVRTGFVDPLSNGDARATVPRLLGGSGLGAQEQVPRLRGGGDEKPSKHKRKLEDNDRLPKGLFWLAGGRGPPITAKSWKQQKPKKRMGGLLGMAIYGHKAGTPYDDKSGTKKEDSPSLRGGSGGNGRDATQDRTGVEESAIGGGEGSAGNSVGADDGNTSGPAAQNECNHLENTRGSTSVESTAVEHTVVEGTAVEKIEAGVSEEDSRPGIESSEATAGGSTDPDPDTTQEGASAAYSGDTVAEDAAQPHSCVEPQDSACDLQPGGVESNENAHSGGSSAELKGDEEKGDEEKGDEEKGDEEKGDEENGGEVRGGEHESGEAKVDEQNSEAEQNTATEQEGPAHKEGEENEREKKGAERSDPGHGLYHAAQTTVAKLRGVGHDLGLLD